MLQVQIIGNLTKDAEIKQSKSGDNWLTFTIAVNEGKDKPATFIRCMRKAFDNTQNLAQYLTKGKKVYAQGRPQVGIYNDQQNNSIRPDITCFVEHIELLSSRSDNEQPNENPPIANPATTTITSQAPQDPFGGNENNNDDLPF